MYQNIFYNRKTNSISLWDDKKGLLTFPYQKYAYSKSTNGKHVAIDGTKVTKILNWSQEDSESGNLYESDMHPETRILIDLYHDSDDLSVCPKIMFYDIETETINGFPDSANPTNAITSISVYYDDLKQSRVYVLSKQNNSTTKGNNTIHEYIKEEDLLLHFLKDYTDYEPSII